MAITNPTHIQKLTADVRGGVVEQADGLVAGSEEAGPLVWPGVAELRVVLHLHSAATHLLQRAQTQPAEVLRMQHQETVQTGEERFNMRFINNI